MDDDRGRFAKGQPSPPHPASPAQPSYPAQPHAYPPPHAPPPGAPHGYAPQAGYAFPHAPPPGAPPGYAPQAGSPPSPHAYGAQPGYPAPHAYGAQPGYPALHGHGHGAPPVHGTPPPVVPPSLRRTHLAAAVKPPTGHGAVAMAMLSMRRAFRLRIDANEVLDDERQQLLSSVPPVADDTQQAFLAWRRSVLFMAALLMIPVAILHAVTNLDFEDGTPEVWKTLSIVGVIVEGGFALFLWTQVGKWTSWRQQSRRLSWAWLVYFLTPFLVFLYPFASAVDYSGGDATTVHAMKVAVGIAVGAQAFISLAPKIISLLQGLIRASIATKTLFPGSSAPGWMMVIAAPLYMVIFYVFVLLPYHFTGSELVLVGTLLVLAAKSSLVRAGLRLTRPMTDEVARATTKRAQSLWMLLLMGGLGCIIGGLWDLISEASLLTIANFALSMGANILLLTLISTDALITALDRARGGTDEERALAAEAHTEIAAFTAVRAVR